MLPTGRVNVVTIHSSRSQNQPRHTQMSNKVFLKLEEEK